MRSFFEIKSSKVPFYLATAAYMLFIAYMSLIRLDAPGEPPDVPQQVFHNLLHIPAYALLTFLWVKNFASVTKRTLFLAAAISVSYSILMEFLQSALTDYRSASVMDVGSNALGAGIVVVAYLKFKIRPI